MKISKLIEDQLLKDSNAPRKKYNLESIKPSSLGCKCMRKLYYEYFKVDTDTGFDLASVVNFKIGNMFHQAIQEILERTGKFIMWVDYKGKPIHEFVMKLEELAIKYSKIDGVLNINDKIWLLEIKVPGVKKFNEKIRLWKEPDEQHLIQGTSYHFGFEENFRRGDYKNIKGLKGWNGEVGGVIYLYVNRDNMKMREFWVGRDTELFKGIAEKCFKIMEFGKKKILPPKTSHFCDWCGYQKKCKKSWNFKEKK